MHDIRLRSERRIDTSSPDHPTLSIVVPTFNESANVGPLVDAVRQVLGGTAWEMIFVDDDSPDRTFDTIREIARTEPRVRCLRRVGRKGLSSAVIEGMLVANAEIVAVMDADFQHDESILPQMLERMINEDADVVVGTRYADGGGVGDWAASRQRMSGLATHISNALVGRQTSDPMSGFFMVRQRVVAAAIYNLSQQGYKILLDILSSSQRPLKVLEVPYVFRSRREGESKISVMVLAEFAFLLIEKLTKGLIPPRFVLFAAVGGLGVGLHLMMLMLLGSLGLQFVAAQAGATYSAMVFNYFLNNEFTFRDKRLRGTSMVIGLLLFVMICSIGAIANIGVAQLAVQQTDSWSLAGILGALMGAVFNFGAASNFVWSRNRRRVVRIEPQPQGA